MEKQKCSLEKCLPIFQTIGIQLEQVFECLCPFSEDINTSFLQKENLKKSLENVHETISNFLLEYDLPDEVKDLLVKILEKLLWAAEYLSFSSIGGGYNVSYDIYHTIKLQKSL